MTTLYLPGEKVPLKIDSLTVYVQQLSMVQKIAIIDKLTQADNQWATLDASRLALKYAVKGLEGVKLSDGTPYQLRMEGNILHDETVEELFHLPCTDKIQAACFALLKGLSNPLTDAAGKPILGVEFASVSPKRAKPTKN